MKRNFIPVYIAIATVFIYFYTCTGYSTGRELQTIYSVGKYRTKSVGGLGKALRNTRNSSPEVQAAWQKIEARAAAAKKGRPSLRTLATSLEAARINNKTNVDTARKAFNLALVYCANRDREAFIRAAVYLRTFRNAFIPEVQLGGIQTNHQYHILYARDWLPYLAYTYDILYNNLNEVERSRTTAWFRRMVQVLAQKKTWDTWKNQTHGAWHASALGIVGSAIGDEKLLALSRSRIREQLGTYVSKEGLWRGGSLSFHYTVTRAYFAYADATKACGDDAYLWKDRYGIAALKQMVNAPLMLLDPFGTIPGNNHMATGPPPGDLYVVAYPRYRDPLFGSVAAEQLAKIPDETLVLHYVKPDENMKVQARPPYSVVCSTLGWGLLRTLSSDPGRTQYARLDFGPHGGSCGHADKLNLYLTGYGRRVTSDDDMYTAQNPLRREWVKHTVAHNTVVVNYRSQLGARTPSDRQGAMGKLLLFDKTPNISIVEADVRNAYPESGLKTYRRCLAMTDYYCIDIFSISALKPITADWVFHGLGKKIHINYASLKERSLQNELVESSMLGTESQGYKWIDDVSAYTANEQWSVTYSSGLKTIMMGQPGTRVMSGKSGGEAVRIGEIVTERSYNLNTIIVRRNNILDTRFVALHEILTSTEPVVESFVRLDTGTDALIFEVMTKTTKDIFILQPKLKRQDIRVDENHLVRLEPRRYGFVRFSRTDDTILDEVNVTVKTY